MKIMYIGQFPVPTVHANSVQVVKMCSAFSGIGHDVHLVVPGEHSDDIEERTFSYYGMEKTFSMQTLSMKPFKTRPFAYAYRCAQLAKKMKPDLVYGRSLHGCFATAMAGIPTIYESHQPPMGRLNPTLFKKMTESKAFRHLVVISGPLGNIFEERGMASDKIIIAHDAADLNELEAGAMEHTGPVKRVGYVGHLLPGRGIDIIVSLAERFLDIEFHIVGGRDVDVAHWKSQPHSENLIFHGHFPHSEVKKYLSTFDVLLAPYQQKVMVGGEVDTSSWMSPLKIFEYMASGKAVICSDLPVLHEVHENERTAMLVTPDSVDSWAEALQKLSDQPELRSLIGRTAREKCEQEYSWTRRAEIVLGS